MSGNIISLAKFKDSKQECCPSYKARILAMDKLELLEEMVVFQQERFKLGHLTPKMMVEGIVLFGALENLAETHELRLLTRSYRRRLKYELEALKNG